MTQQIKKYRRKVSHDRVERAAKALVEKAINDNLSIDPIPDDIAYILALAALETDTEIVEGNFKQGYLDKWYFITDINCEVYSTPEKFYEKWVEISDS